MDRRLRKHPVSKKQILIPSRTRHENGRSGSELRDGASVMHRPRTPKRKPDLSADNKANCDRTDFPVRRMLLWEHVARGKPEVPVDRLKQEWRARGLSKFVQLTISGCLGPCDLVNVVRISGDRDDIWLGNLRSIEDYLDLVTWAEQSKIGRSIGSTLPADAGSRFDPFRPPNCRPLLNRNGRHL